MDLIDLLVVVIEPSKVQRNIITGRLREHGINTIEEFTEASSALEYMLSQHPDIVVSSMHLPDMTGTELLEQMRMDPNLADITFLLISSETHYRYLEPIRQAGAIAILPKPFSGDELSVALRSTLNYLTDTTNEEPNVNEDNEHLQVLVVDDSRLSRKYVRQMLEGLGVEQIQEAEDGAQALSIMGNQHFDLIITDYNMPNIDGRELTEHIRHDSDQPTVPILMITSEQSQQRLAAIQQAGVSAVVSKPLSYENVKSLIENLVHEI
ncbi:response regulator [Marinobacterium sp. CAU 1594]|nr:response regulator [Marinobacterium arenosum]